MYFPKSAARNLVGSTSLEELVPPRELSTSEIREFDGIVIDVRPDHIYGAGHVPNSINIGLGGQFASWAGTMVPIGASIAIFADTKAQVDEAAIRLARVGHDSVVGFILSGDYDGESKTVEQVAVQGVNELLKTEDKIQFVDVRRPAEHANVHAPETINLPLNRLSQEFEKLDPSLPTYVVCQGGYRSSIGTSILEKAGFTNLFNVTGGTAAWIAAGFETETSATTCAATRSN
jgi:rhodanese-related sulfurtransferase